MSTAANAGPRRFQRPGEALVAVAGVAKAVPALARVWRGGLPRAHREAIMVAVSRANECERCATAHERWAVRAGVSEPDLQAIGLGHWAALNPALREAIAYATGRAEERFATPASVKLEELGEGLDADRRELVEALARVICFANLSVGTLSGLRRRSGARRRGSSPVFARVWNLLADRAVSTESRRAVLAGTAGRVLEVGAGNGANFALYPDSVQFVLAVEPEPYLRSVARGAATHARVPVEVVDGTAAAIPAPDGSFDAAVCCLVLCSVPDQAAALAEIRRVLRPDGRLHLYEHVVATDRRCHVQRVLDRTGIWPRLAAGCHLSRDTQGALIAAGFTLERVEVVEAGVGGLTIPHVLGVVRA